MFDLLGMKVTINSIEVNDAVIHAFVDAKGYSNSYVLQPQHKSTTKSKKAVVISNLELQNVTAISENAVNNKRFEVRFNNAEADMTLTGSKYNINLKEDVFVRGFRL